MKRAKPSSRTPIAAGSRRAQSGVETHAAARQAKVQAIVAVALLIGSVALLYSQAIHAPFIFDDEEAVLHNPSIVRLSPLVGTTQNPGPLRPPREFCVAGRPLVNLSLAVNYYFGRIDPTGYHAFNMAVHILSSLVLWGIMRRTLRLDFFASRFAEAADVLALLVALLWALHPLQTETVQYVTQRTELMVDLCYLGTLYASLRYWEAQSVVGRQSWLAVASLLCLAGMASKEMMVSAPVMVLLFERTFLTGSFRQALVKSWPLYAGLAAGWLLLLGLNYSGPRSGSAGFSLGVPAHVWWFTQSQVLFMYLRLAIWPWPLVIHYPLPLLDTFTAAWPWLLPAVALGVGTLVLLARRTAAGFVGAWVLVILSPTLVVPIVKEIAVERRMYLPLAALVALVVASGYVLLDKRLARRAPDAPSAAPRPVTVAPKLKPALAITIACGLILCCVYAVVDSRRLTYFNDPVLLWQDALVHYPDSATIHTNLGVALSNAGYVDEAIREYQEAARLDPSERGSRENLAQVYYGLGLRLVEQQKPDEAIPQYLQAIEIDPQLADAHYALAGVLMNRGDLAGAVQHYSAAVELRPRYIPALLNLGRAMTNLGELDRAVEYFRRALREKPDDTEVRHSLGIALARQGKAAEAADEYRAILQLDPRRPDIHYEFANQLAGLGDMPQAVAHYREALRLRPDYTEALQNLGAALLAMGKTEEAIVQLEEVLRRQPDNPQARANLERARALRSQAMPR